MNFNKTYIDEKLMLEAIGYLKSKQFYKTLDDTVPQTSSLKDVLYRIRHLPNQAQAWQLTQILRTNEWLMSGELPAIITDEIKQVILQQVSDESLDGKTEKLIIETCGRKIIQDMSEAYKQKIYELDPEIDLDEDYAQELAEWQERVQGFIGMFAALMDLIEKVKIK